jgi:16S rRNA (guanine527-N7)-methyltransferase
VEHAGDLVRWSAALGVHLDGSHLEQFALYLREFLNWNRKINLSGLSDQQDIILKHFIDSLACSKAIDARQPDSSPSSLLDIGSGAGFPGIPLKLIYPDLEVTLLEPNLKKTAFLHHIIGTLRLSHISVASMRLEDYARQATRPQFTYAITRAVNLLPLMNCVTPLLDHGGRLILCRATPLEREEKEGVGNLVLEREIEYELPQRAGTRVLSVLKPKAHRVPRGTLKAGCGQA